MGDMADKDVKMKDIVDRLSKIAGKDDGDRNRAIITVLGIDKVGIVAEITRILADARINILDISQTILGEFFSMSMLVDLTGAEEDFSTIREKLEAKGREMQLQVVIQHENVFRYMYRV